jgi:uncharacterized membrane protein YccC
MNTTSALVLAAALAVVGTWAKNDRVNFRMAVGFAVLFILLSIGADINEKLANAFGILIVLTAALLYVPSIVRKLGF